MDWLITAAARALAAGDPLGALNRVALRDDAPALALRGIAMAQLGDLKQVLAIEGRSRMRGDINRAQRLPARRIEGVQLVSGGKPNMLTVIRDAMHVVDTRKGSILTDDFGR